MHPIYRSSGFIDVSMDMLPDSDSEKLPRSHMQWREEQEGEVSPNSFTAFRAWGPPTAASSLAGGSSSSGGPSGIGSSSQDPKANHELEEEEEDEEDSFGPFVENTSFAGMAGRGLRKARKILEDSLAEMTTREEAVGRCGFSTPAPAATPEAAPAPGQHAPRPKSAPLRRWEGLAARSTAPPEGGGGAAAGAAAPPLRGASGPVVLAWAVDVPAIGAGVGATFEDHLQSRGSPSTRASSPSAVAPEFVPLSTSGFAVPRFGEMSLVIAKKAETTRSVPTTIPEVDQEDEAMAGVAGSSQQQLERGRFRTESRPMTSTLMVSTRHVVPVPPRGPNTRPRRYRAQSAADAGSPASSGASSAEPSSGAASSNSAVATAAGLSVVVEDEQVMLR